MINHRSALRTNFYCRSSRKHWKRRANFMRIFSDGEKLLEFGIGKETKQDSSEVKVGALAPDFALRDESGDCWRLSEHRGRVVALLFYPGDETLVCTRQMCSVRDHWADYVATGAEVVGVSPGTMKAHSKFARHHDLPLRLLADEDGKVTQLYSAHRWMPVRTTRTLVVLDAEGVIRYRRVMLRIFRPFEKEVLLAIRMAQYDALAAERLARS